MFNKNDILQLTIEDMGVNGEGIGKFEGYTFFIKDAVVGDYVEAKVMKANKNYGFAKLVNVITPSIHRVEPKCIIANKCGGCQLQYVSYEEQLRFKENKVKNNLERIGKIFDFTMHPIIGMDNPYYYRNKSQIPVGLNKEGQVIAGFYAERTHSIIDTTNCMIAPEINQEIITAVKAFMTEYQIAPYNEESHKGLVRHILIRNSFKMSEIMVCIVINGNKLPQAEKLVAKLNNIKEIVSIVLNINKEKTNVIMGQKNIYLYGNETITDKIDDLQFKISALSFYQINPIQTEKLYRTALDYAGLTGKEVVWDLYCGIGTISLFLARRALKVYGVEIVHEAIEDARNNAKLNQIENTEFLLGKSEEVFPSFYAENNEAPDVVVVDPPRKGCDEQLLEAIVRVGPERIVYISCDSSTLARDVHYMCERGYAVKDVQPVDLFPQTVHVEVVTLLVRE